MKSFLVATDFSEPSREAALYAANLAKSLGAELTLLHAYLLPTPVSEVPYVMVSVDELQKDNEKLAREMAANLQQQTGITVKTIVNIGMPADEIVYQAKEIGAELIVIGMRGENTALDKFIGSTTVAVIRKSHIPVLVVPAKNSYVALQNLTYATDFSYTMNPRCLEALGSLLKSNPGAKLHVVNFQRPGEIMSAEQISGKVRLEPMLEKINHQYHSLENSSVEAGLVEFLNQQPSQMLVMVAHKHSWWERLVSGSHTREMAYKSNIPLLVLQDKD
ncbi:universal stress protein [Flavihumibacter profundi]|jgi:nucleotide-binding universal stress UspA family protein|uniref:universal stress protein n=1 Tax=Flavihumibacter profundi TaxID=2716883 RepID=UPI001CC63208|nr:universal stress protein [Flavihumibacter profundi]MBZ5858168.1 universal stress protein [Flavihumibacter profundi]